MKRGDLYLVEKATKNDTKKQRVYVVVSRQALIDSVYSTIICAPVYTKRIFFYNSKDKTRKKIDKDGNEIEIQLENEIDLIIEENGTLYPIEIKKKDMPNVNDASAFDVLDKDIDKKRGLGVIISSNKNKVFIRDNLICLPIEYI